MPDYRVQWTNVDSSVEVDLIDSVGPKNDYMFLDPNAVIPSKGEFMNQFSKVTPDDGSWTMSDFDNKTVYPLGHQGKGEVFGIADGTFPKGIFDWTIVKK